MLTETEKLNYIKYSINQTDIVIFFLFLIILLYKI